MSNKKKPVIQEVEASAIDPVYTDKTTWAPTHFPDRADPMQQILQGMLAMQAKTNETLEKLSDKIDSIADKPVSEWLVSQEDMAKHMGSSKLTQRKMYKVLIIKRVIPISPEDQSSWFNNAGIERGDTNKRFDNEKEAIAFGEETAPGKYKLMPVSVPISEWATFKKRNMNLQI